MQTDHRTNHPPTIPTRERTMNRQTISPVDTTPAARESQGWLSRRRAARMAGIGYVLIFVLAIFANFYVREGLVEPDNAAATVANITESMGLFRLGMVAFLAIFVLDVVIAWALHIVFRDANRDLSLVTAWFRLVYTVFLGVALVFLFQVLQFLSGADYVSALGSDQVNAQVMIALDSFNATWLVGLAAFGLHLVLLGVLIIRSGLASRWMAYLLMAAGGAYVLDTVANVTLANYADLAPAFLVMVALPSVIGEGWLGLWLLLSRRIAR
jgi:magnesium-transporting ATPase (P-type)